MVPHMSEKSRLKDCKCSEREKTRNAQEKKKEQSFSIDAFMLATNTYGAPAYFCVCVCVCMCDEYYVCILFWGAYVYICRFD